MKRILLAVLLLSGLMASGQSVGRLRYDTTILEKVGGSNELKIKNNTRDSVGGIFTNVGGGWGRWLKPRTNFDTLFIGLDTVIVGSSPVNIYNADGILTGFRRLSGNNGTYGMEWDSMKYVTFRVYNGDFVHEFQMDNFSGAMAMNTQNAVTFDIGSVESGDGIARLRSANPDFGKEVLLYTTPDSIVSTYAQAPPFVSSIGTDDRVVIRTPGGGLRYSTPTAIGGKFGRTGDASNSTGGALAFDNSAQAFSITNMKGSIFEDDDSLRIQKAGVTRLTVGDTLRTFGPIKIHDGRVIQKKTTASEFWRVLDENGQNAVQYSWNRTSRIQFNYLYQPDAAFHWNLFDDPVNPTATWIIFGVKRYLTRVSDTAYFGLGNYPGDPSTYEPPQEGYMWMNDATANFRGYRNGLSRSFMMNNTGYGVDTVYLNGAGDSLVFEIFGRRYAFVQGAGGGGGEVNTASNLGGGLANYDSKSGVDLRFNSFTASDFNLASNLISLDYTNGQAASGSNNGFLTSADWTTFNNKQQTVSFTTPTGTNANGGSIASGVITLSLADATNPGLMSATTQSFSGQKTNAGLQIMNAGFQTNTTGTNSNFAVPTGGSFGNVTDSKFLLAGASTVSTRSYFSGTGGTMVANQPYFTTIWGASPVTEPSSGNIPLLGSVGIRAPNVTGAAGTVGDGYTLYIEGAPTVTTSGGTGALWIDAGEFRTDGNIKVTNPVQVTTLDSVVAIEEGILKTAPLSSGTYTPTITNGANVASSSNSSARYQRIGNIVTVTVAINVTATAGATLTTVDVSLPIASNLGAFTDLAGTANESGNLTTAVVGDATNDRATVSYTSAGTSSTRVTFQFMYTII